MTLCFNPDTHVYTVAGEIMPSVTTILQATGFIDATWFDEYSRDRGRYVHQARHLYDAGKLDEESLDPIIKPYLEAYKAFKRDTGFLPSASEEPLFSPTHRFCGTPDAWGTFRDITPVLLDFKSGAIARWTGLQLAAYELLKGEGPGRKRIGVQLCPTGKYKIREFRDRQDRNIFLAALSCYYWQKTNGR